MQVREKLTFESVEVRSVAIPMRRPIVSRVGTYPEWPLILIDLPISIPKELGGLGKPGTTNPEELFAAGSAACSESAILRAARERKVRLEGSSVTARVGIGRMENGRFNLKVDLAVSLAGIALAEAESLANAAHAEICPYSRATRGNVEVSVSVL
jgi:Ohr subfamily peroxiredoxin